MIFSDCFIFGGCEIVLTNLANSRLINRDFDVTYSYRKFEEYDDEVKRLVGDEALLSPIRLLSNDTFLYKISLKKPTFLTNCLKCFLGYISKSGIYHSINFFILWYYFRKTNPDIIFINNGGYPGSSLSRLAVFSATFSRINKILFNVNNLALTPKRIWENKIDILIGKFVYKFITASKAAKSHLSESRGFPLDQIVTIPNCVQDRRQSKGYPGLKDEFNIKDNEVILGGVGLLTKRKGFAVLLDSLKILADKHVETILKVFIIGEGEERSNLQNQINLLGIDKQVKLIGVRGKILNYINDFDIFILPSISNEDMPYVVLEAMMLKKPVIASRVAGTPEEVLHGQTGIIVNPESPEELADAIQLLAKDKSLRLNYGLRGYERYDLNFRYEVVMKQYQKFFRSL